MHTLPGHAVASIEALFFSALLGGLIARSGGERRAVVISAALVGLLIGYKAST